MRCDRAWFCACLRFLWRCTFGGNVSLPCALGSAVKFYGVRFNLNYCWVAKWLRGYLPVGGCLCLFPRFSGLWENVREYILRVRDFVWFNVEIISRALIRLGSVERGSARWDDCDFCNFCLDSGIVDLVCDPVLLRKWPGVLCATTVSRGSNGHGIRVSIQSWVWRIKFSSKRVAGSYDFVSR